MLINLSITELEILKKQNLATPVSRWESREKAEAYYSKVEGIYVAYKEDVTKLKSAYSTPVRIYLIKEL